MKWKVVGGDRRVQHSKQQNSIPLHRQRTNAISVLLRNLHTVIYHHRHNLNTQPRESKQHLVLPNNSDPHVRAVSVARSQGGEINKQRREEVQDIHMPEGRAAVRGGQRQIHNRGKE